MRVHHALAVCALMAGLSPGAGRACEGGGAVLSALPASPTAYSGVALRANKPYVTAPALPDGATPPAYLGSILQIAPQVGKPAALTNIDDGQGGGRDTPVFDTAGNLYVLSTYAPGLRRFAPPSGKLGWRDMGLVATQGAPINPPIATSTGALIVPTKKGGGVAYQLEAVAPAPGGVGWTQTTLVRFGGAGETNLWVDAIDPQGNLYARVQRPAGQTVYRVAAPATAGGAWTATALATFAPPRRLDPLMVDVDGNLFAIQRGLNQYAQVIELVRPATPDGTWDVATRYAFSAGSPVGYDARGTMVNLLGVYYGATAAGGPGGGGVVWKLSPPSAANKQTWTMSTCATFTTSDPRGWAPKTGVQNGHNGFFYYTLSAGLPDIAPGGAVMKMQQ